MIIVRTLHCLDVVHQRDRQADRQTDRRAIT